MPRVVWRILVLAALVFASSLTLRVAWESLDEHGPEALGTVHFGAAKDLKRGFGNGPCTRCVTYYYRVSGLSSPPTPTPAPAPKGR
jgi:hypothetical protein